jgi:adenosylcobinamide-GDP ribazoletransferase
MNGFLSALRFITIIPAGHDTAFEPQKMVPFFPAVGLLLGLIVALFDQIWLALFNAPVAGLLDVIVLVVLTGALHIDGLGDSADGLFSHRSLEKKLIIMKDSRIGMMGLVTVVLVLAIKWAGLSNLSQYRPLAIILIPAFARSSMLFGFKFLPYGRPEGGTGHAFFENKTSWTDFWGLIPIVILSFFLGWHGFLLWAGFCLGTATILWFYKKQLNCITGDMLGAMCEVLEAVLFLLVSI